MPRLTNVEYLIRHEMVHKAWLKDKSAFAHLTYHQQRDVHDYYGTTEIGEDEELLEYRDMVTQKDPSLPHRASKAFLALLRRPIVLPPYKPKRQRVRPAIRPKIDVEVLGAALWELAERLPREELEKLAAEADQMKSKRGRAA